jgi:hypothetical protein
MHMLLTERRLDGVLPLHKPIPSYALNRYNRKN